MVHFPLLTWGGRSGGRACTGVQASHHWNKDDGGTIGVQVQAESRGGDLGNDGGRSGDPAICPGQ